MNYRKISIYVILIYKEKLMTLLCVRSSYSCIEVSIIMLYQYVIIKFYLCYGRLKHVTMHFYSLNVPNPFVYLHKIFQLNRLYK